MAHSDYPFIPKSNRSLSVGDFWGVPLSNGTYACGRILQLPSKESELTRGSKTLIFVGLLDWNSTSEPTFDSIAGARVCKQGAAHIKTISMNGERVLGNRPLELDGIVIPYETHAAGPPCNLLQGFNIIRPAVKSDFEKYETRVVWGFKVISNSAECRFLKK